MINKTELKLQKKYPEYQVKVLDNIEFDLGKFFDKFGIGEDGDFGRMYLMDLQEPNMKEESIYNGLNKFNNSTGSICLESKDGSRSLVRASKRLVYLITYGVDEGHTNLHNNILELLSKKYTIKEKTIENLFAIIPITFFYVLLTTLAFTKSYLLGLFYIITGIFCYNVFFSIGKVKILGIDSFAFMKGENVINKDFRTFSRDILYLHEGSKIDKIILFLSRVFSRALHAPNTLNGVKYSSGKMLDPNINDVYKTFISNNDDDIKLVKWHRRQLISHGILTLILATISYGVLFYTVDSFYNGLLVFSIKNGLFISSLIIIPFFFLAALASRYLNRFYSHSILVGDLISIIVELNRAVKLSAGFDRVWIKYLFQRIILHLDLLEQSASDTSKFEFVSSKFGDIKSSIEYIQSCLYVPISDTNRFALESLKDILECCLSGNYGSYQSIVPQGVKYKNKSFEIKNYFNLFKVLFVAAILSSMWYINVNSVDTKEFGIDRERINLLAWALLAIIISQGLKLKFIESLIEIIKR